MCMIGILVNGILQQNISEDAIIQSVQFAHSGDEWSYNFSIANNMKDGKWEYSNEQIFEAVDIGLSDLTVADDGATYLTYSYVLPSGGTIQQSTRLEMEMGEFKVSDDDDDEKVQDLAEVAADEIISKMKEIFGFTDIQTSETLKGAHCTKNNKDSDPPKTMEEAFKKYMDNQSAKKCCKDGCCCKKKRQQPPA